MNTTSTRATLALALSLASLAGCNATSTLSLGGDDGGDAGPRIAARGSLANPLPDVAGNVWTALSSGVTTDLRGVYVASASDVWIVGSAGTALHYDGARFTPAAIDPHLDLVAVWGSGASDVYALGHDAGDTVPVLLHYAGAAWSTVSNDWHGGLVQIGGTGPRDVWLVGTRTDGANLWHFDGSAWSDTSVPRVNLSEGYALAAVATNRVFVLGNASSLGEVGLSLLDGSAWLPTAGVGAEFLARRAFAVGPSDVWVVGDVDGTARCDGMACTPLAAEIDDGRAQSMQLALQDVWSAATDDVWMVGRATDSSALNGTSTHRSATSHWDGHQREAVANPGTQTLYAVRGSSANDVFAVGDQGTVLHFGPAPSTMP